MQRDLAVATTSNQSIKNETEKSNFGQFALLETVDLGAEQNTLFAARLACV